MKKTKKKYNETKFNHVFVVFPVLESKDLYYFRRILDLLDQSREVLRSLVF